MTISREFSPLLFDQLQTLLRKQYSHESVLLSGADPLPTVQVVPIGDPVLDALLSGQSDVGGIPRGMITEISGPNSAGKTTLAQEILSSFMRSFPKRGGAFVDAECATDINYLQVMEIPVKEKRFAFSRPNQGKEALHTIAQLAKTGMFSCIVLDSFAALDPPHSEKKDREIGDSQIGSVSKMAAEAFRELKPILAANDCALIIINQERIKMTAMGPRGIQTTGGEVIAYWSDLRLRITHGDKDSGERIIKVIKSKTQAIASSEATFYIQHGIGIDRTASLYNQLVEKNLLTVVGGGNHTIPFMDGTEFHKVKGKENLFDLLKQNSNFRSAACKALSIPDFSPRLSYHVKRPASQLTDPPLIINQEE
jgi:recombination protein RecA